MFWGVIGSHSGASVSRVIFHDPAKGSLMHLGGIRY